MASTHQALVVPVVLTKHPTADSLGLCTIGGFTPGGVPCREGVVVRPVKERHDPRIGRVVLKIVGNGYLEKA